MRPGALSIKREYFTSVLISDSQSKDADGDSVVLTLNVFTARVGVELAWRFVDVLDLHGGAGVHLQYIARDATYETAGVAPVVMAGARVYFDRVVSLALETELHFAASNVIHVGTDLLPQGAVSWTGGLSLAFHVS